MKTSFDWSSSSEDDEKENCGCKQSSKRVRWSAEELELLAATFGDMGKPPCSVAIMEFQQKYPIFEKRTVAQIKSRAWHFIRTGR